VRQFAPYGAVEGRITRTHDRGYHDYAFRVLDFALLNLKQELVMANVVVGKIIESGQHARLWLGAISCKVNQKTSGLKCNCRSGRPTVMAWA
jgi:hypothetical protein